MVDALLPNASRAFFGACKMAASRPRLRQKRRPFCFVARIGDEGHSRFFCCRFSIEAEAVQKFQRLYLPPFLLATFADWIQGPYQYKVYTAYGFDEHDIGRLYICGFGSSLLFGTYVAGVADT